MLMDIEKGNEMKEKKQVIDLAVNFIYKHINEPLNVKQVADNFGFSEYYFNRIFREVTGESVYALIKRLKMEQSAIALKTEKEKTITDIGLDYGYSASNYSSAFNKHMHKAPSIFRESATTKSMKNPFIPQRVEYFLTFEAYDAQVRIEVLEEKEVLYERLKGDYSELKNAWAQFIQDYKEYMSEDTLLIERFFDDPSITNKEHSVCDLCVEIKEKTSLPNRMVLAGGKYALCRYEGKIGDIFGWVQGLYKVWLPQSKYEMREHFSMNIYRTMSCTEGSVVMDCCIPIK